MNGFKFFLLLLLLIPGLLFSQEAGGDPGEPDPAAVEAPGEGPGNTAAAPKTAAGPGEGEGVSSPVEAETAAASTAETAPAEDAPRALSPAPVPSTAAFSPGLSAPAGSVEARRIETLRYGTETEISTLIQTLRTEKSDYLDGELVKLADVSRNRSILTGIFAFFAERAKGGLESRAIRAVEERDDEASETVLAAIDYLGKLKAAEAADSLREIIDSGERAYMAAAFRALGQAGSSGGGGEAAEFLVDFYTRRNPADDQRREIIAAIGETKSSGGIDFLSGLVRNGEERVTLRIAGLEALAKIGDPKGLDAVLSAVPAPDPNIRAAAVSALGPFSGDAVDKALYEAFRDSFWRTRLAAASAAGARKLAGAVPYLRYRAENDEVPQVKDEAIRALGAIGGGEAVDILKSLFAERKNSDRVRILAGEMLIQADPGRYAGTVIAELDDAKRRSQTALYNGLLKDISGAKTPGVEDFVRRLFASGGVVEKSYALDMCIVNEFRGLAGEIRALTPEKNGSLSRKAVVTLERLGLSAE
jgi:HEAT repeat protein